MPLRVDRQVVEILCSLASETEHNESATIDVSITPSATVIHEAILAATVSAAIEAACGATTVVNLSASASIEVSVDAIGNIAVYDAAVECPVEVAVSVQHTAVAAATVSCDVTPVADVIVVKHASATAAIVVETQVAVQCVFSLSSEIEIQVVTQEIELTGYTLVDVITGLDCSVTVNQDHTLSATQPIGIHVNAANSLVRADGIEVSAEVAIEVAVATIKNETGSATVATPVTVSASVDKCSVCIAALTPGCTAGVTVSHGVSATCAVSVDVALAYTVLSADVVYQYSPFVGSGPASNPTPPAASLVAPLDADTGCRFVYPAEGSVTDSLSLRPPQLGNRDRLSFNRILTESRGGTLIAYSEVTWPKTHTLVMTFSALTAAEKSAFLTFMSDHLGQEIGFIDWECHYWRGIILTPGEAVVQDRSNSYTVNVEFEGELDPEWTP